MMLERPLPRVTPGLAKLIEVILFLIKEAANENLKATQYTIVKSIFIADDNHLKSYGRPVTFSNYAAMFFGPVPSEAYDMLKPSFNWARVGLEGAPWKSAPAPQISQRALEYSISDRGPNLRALSETDKEHLIAALKLVKTLGFGGTKDFTHRHPAYLAAWKDNDTRKSFEMNYLKIIPDEDEELLADLVHASKFAS